MKQTVKQGQSLLERYQNATPHPQNATHFPERSKLVVELQGLLEGELCHKAGLSNYYSQRYEENQELLKEFRENFTWDQNDSVRVIWDVSAEYEEYQDFDTKEDLINYLGKDKSEIATPDEVDPNELDIDFDGVYAKEPSVSVWRLKAVEDKCPSA